MQPHLKADTARLSGHLSQLTPTAAFKSLAQSNTVPLFATMKILLHIHETHFC